MQIKKYQLLEDFKAEQKERAEKLGQYQQDAEAARARLNELQTQYEYTFTQSVKDEKDATAELDKIADDIALQKEVVARRERDFGLVRSAMPPTKLTSLEVVERYRPEYASGIREEFEELVNPKLMLARNLIMSALEDGKRFSKAYQPITEEIQQHAKGNHQRGLTESFMYQDHPTDNARIHNAQGTVSGVRKLLQSVSEYTQGKTPPDYTYIEVAPTVAPKTTEKEGK